MSQTKFESFKEAMFNVSVGYLIAIASQIVIFPWFGIHIPLSTNFAIGAWFTLISICRSYIIRRFFNKKIIQDCDKCPFKEHPTTSTRFGKS